MLVSSEYTHAHAHTHAHTHTPSIFQACISYEGVLSKHLSYKKIRHGRLAYTAVCNTVHSLDAELLQVTELADRGREGGQLIVGEA